MQLRFPARVPARPRHPCAERGRGRRHLAQPAGSHSHERGLGLRRRRSATRIRRPRTWWAAVPTRPASTPSPRPTISSACACASTPTARAPTTSGSSSSTRTAIPTTADWVLEVRQSGNPANRQVLFIPASSGGPTLGDVAFNGAALWTGALADWSLWGVGHRWLELRRRCRCLPRRRHAALHVPDAHGPREAPTHTASCSPPAPPRTSSTRTCPWVSHPRQLLPVGHRACARARKCRAGRPGAAAPRPGTTRGALRSPRFPPMMGRTAGSPSPAGGGPWRRGERRGEDPGAGSSARSEEAWRASSARAAGARCGSPTWIATASASSSACAATAPTRASASLSSTRCASSACCTSRAFRWRGCTAGATSRPPT